MTVGLLLTSAALATTTQVSTLGPLVALLVVAGACGASVNAASGRAVLGWFGPGERGFAMGVRQTALPLGAGLAAAVLPVVAAARGLDAAFWTLSSGTLLAAVAVAVWVREAPSQQPGRLTGPSPLRDPRVRRLAAASFLLVVPQFAVVAFLVLFLHDEHGFSVPAAALLLAGVQLAGGAGRVVAGRVADRLGARVRPLLALAATIGTAYAVLALVAGTRAAVPVVLVAGVLGICWNGLAFTAAGELAGPGRAGTALGLQNTAVALGAAATAPVLGTVVDATSYGTGFALAAGCAVAAALLLRPLRAL